MRKNYSKSSSSHNKSGNKRDSSPSKSQHKPQNRPQGSGRSEAKAPTFPKNWRAVAGDHALNELVRVRKKSIKHFWLETNWMSSAEIRNFMENFKGQQITFDLKSDLDMKRICASHQGVIAFSDVTPEFDYMNTGWDQNGLIVALDGVEDPHNLGAIMRTSWLMGVNGIILPADRAVGLTATVHKVACGGVEHVPLAHINNFADPFTKLKEAGFWVFGMSHKAKKTIYDLKIPEKVIWVMGAEDKGLRIPTERACDELVSIPQIAADASYNVSVATALALAETKRQWK